MNVRTYKRSFSLKIDRQYIQLVFALFSFFLLEQKEPKIQDKPDLSGRFAGPLRDWAVIVLVAIILAMIVEV